MVTIFKVGDDLLNFREVGRRLSKWNNGRAVTMTSAVELLVIVCDDQQLDAILGHS